jgi:hypothetical protein
VDYYLNNKYYNISESNFGKPDVVRFDNFDVYDYNMMLSEIQKILNICIDVNSKILKRRGVEVKQLPTEFEITELRKQIQNNIESFSTFTEIKTNVYNPAIVNVEFDDKISSTPIIPEPIVEPQPIEVPPAEPTPIYIPPATGGGTIGGGGGGFTERDLGTGLGREQLFEGDSNQRENIL